MYDSRPVYALGILIQTHLSRAPGQFHLPCPYPSWTSLRHSANNVHAETPHAPSIHPHSTPIPHSLNPDQGNMHVSQSLSEVSLLKLDHLPCLLCVLSSFSKEFGPQSKNLESCS